MPQRSNQSNRKRGAKIGSAKGPRSMTGFGVCSRQLTVSDSCKIELEVEIKSYNHRYFDPVFKLPRIYNRFENDLRALVAKFVSRGRLEVFVSRKVLQHSSKELKFDQNLFEGLLEIYRRALKKRTDAALDQAIVFEILRRSEVLGLGDNETSSKSEYKFLQDALLVALKAHDSMRAKEGFNLMKQISQGAKGLKGISKAISAATKLSPIRLKQKLLERVSALSPELTIDPARLTSEATILADRVDVSEELVRLASHLDQFDSSKGINSSGKKLDFLLQEILREFNTISSKASNAEVQSKVVDAKVIIEQLREQVQNFE